MYIQVRHPDDSSMQFCQPFTESLTNTRLNKDNSREEPTSKWAYAWRNKQNDLCAQRRLRSDWSESSLFAWRRFMSFATHKEHSEDSDAQPDLSLPWAHISFCLFCHAQAQIHMNVGHDTTKRVLGISDPARHKPACAATEASMRLELLVTDTRDITLLSCGSGWSAPLLFAYGIRHVFSWPGSSNCVPLQHSDLWVSSALYCDISCTSSTVVLFCFFTFFQFLKPTTVIFLLKYPFINNAFLLQNIFNNYVSY